MTPKEQIKVPVFAPLPRCPLALILLCASAEAQVPGTYYFDYVDGKDYPTNNGTFLPGRCLLPAGPGDYVTLVENNNLIQDPTGQPYYSLATLYAPQSALAPTVGMGANLNSFFTTDISNVTRGTTWDIGAYQLVYLKVVSAAGASISAKSSFGAPVVFKTQ